jgi:hypothetical protein
MVKPARQDSAALRVTELFCERLQHKRTAEEHLACAYCSGDEAAVQSGRRELFCEFVRGRDPTHFGFPDGSERLLHG